MKTINSIQFQTKICVPHTWTTSFANAPIPNFKSVTGGKRPSCSHQKVRKIDDFYLLAQKNLKIKIWTLTVKNIYTKTF